MVSNPHGDESSDLKAAKLHQRPALCVNLQEICPQYSCETTTLHGRRTALCNREWNTETCIQECMKLLKSLLQKPKYDINSSSAVSAQNGTGSSATTILVHLLIFNGWTSKTSHLLNSVHLLRFNLTMQIERKVQLIFIYYKKATNINSKWSTLASFSQASLLIFPKTAPDFWHFTPRTFTFTWSVAFCMAVSYRLDGIWS